MSMTYLSSERLFDHAASIGVQGAIQSDPIWQLDGLLFSNLKRTNVSYLA